MSSTYTEAEHYILRIVHRMIPLNLRWSCIIVFRFSPPESLSLPNQDIHLKHRPIKYFAVGQWSALLLFGIVKAGNHYWFAMYNDFEIWCYVSVAHQSKIEKIRCCSLYICCSCFIIHDYTWSRSLHATTLFTLYELTVLYFILLMMVHRHDWQLAIHVQSTDECHLVQWTRTEYHVTLNHVSYRELK